MREGGGRIQERGWGDSIIERWCINTEGLLLLTNDGGLARALELPDNRLAARLPRPRHWRGDAGAASMN